jgi:hypothetical protein
MRRRGFLVLLLGLVIVISLTTITFKGLAEPLSMDLLFSGNDDPYADLAIGAPGEGFATCIFR